MEHTIIAVVMVMDSSGKTFNIDQLDHMMLLPHPYTSHITVRLIKIYCTIATIILVYLQAFVTTSTC